MFRVGDPDLLLHHNVVGFNGNGDSRDLGAAFAGHFPPARSYLAMTYDAASGKIIMFGGYDGATYLNDTWLFDGVSWTRAPHSRVSPRPRANAQMAYDSVTRKVVLFGGYNGTHYLGDTWIWDGTTLQWIRARPPHSPPAVTGPMLFPDPKWTGRRLRRV